MPISGDQCLDKNDPDYGLPLDTCCVGGAGPSPTEVTTISGSTGKSTTFKGLGSVPVGYDGP